MLGLSIGGFGYLSYVNHQRIGAYQRQLAYSGATVEGNMVTERMKSTMIYFAGGLTTTSALVALMMRSPKIVAMGFSMWPLLLTIPGVLICGYGMRSTPDNSKSNNLTKHMFWLGMNTLIAFSLTPLIALSDIKLVADAFLLSSGAFGGLALAAYNSHDTAFLGMSGILGAGFGALFAISLANLFFQSHGLYNIWLYGGLALFIGLTLYDMKNIQVRAQRQYYFDPMSESLNIYFDFINIFVRILAMKQQNKK